MELGAGQSLAFLGPELALAATALVVWLLGRVRGHDRGESDVGVVGAAFAVFLAARLTGWGEVWLCDRLLIVDGLAVFAKIAVGLVVVGALWIEADSQVTVPASGGDAPRVLVAAIGLELVCSAANTWIAFASLELACVTAASVGARLRPDLAVEARLGPAVASLALLASLAWLTGFAGSADFERLRSGLFEVAPRHALSVSIAAWTAVAAIVARVAFVAERTDSHAQRGLLVGAELTAGVVVLVVRLFFGALSEPVAGGRWLAPEGLDWHAPIGFAAALAMACGSVFALRARSLERLLTASSIVNAGYALVAASAATVDGFRALLLLVAVTTVATIGAFFAASLLSRDGGDGLDHHRGLLRGRITTRGVALVIFLPLLGGMTFLGCLPDRVHLLSAALASLAALLLAYGRVLRVMLGGKRDGLIHEPAAVDLCLLALIASASVWLGLHPEPLLRFVGRSAHLLPF